MRSSRRVAVRLGCKFYLHFLERGCTLRPCAQMWGPPAIMVSSSAGLLKCLSVWFPPVCGMTLLDGTEEAGFCFEGISMSPASSWGWSALGGAGGPETRIARKVILGLLERRQSCYFAHFKSCCWSWVMDLQNNHTAPESWSLFFHWADQTQFTESILCVTFFSCQ